MMMRRSLTPAHFFLSIVAACRYPRIALFSVLYYLSSKNRFEIEVGDERAKRVEQGEGYA